MKAILWTDLAAAVVALLALLATTTVFLLSIRYLASKMELVPVLKQQAPLRLATYAAMVWLLEWIVFVLAVVADAKYHWFGFSSEAGEGGLYFLIVGPIVFVATWVLARWFLSLPTDSRGLLLLGAKIGYFTTIAPFVLMLLFYCLSLLFRSSSSTDI